MAGAAFVLFFAAAPRKQSRPPHTLCAGTSPHINSACSTYYECNIPRETIFACGGAAAEFCGTIKLTRGDACVRRQKRCAKFAPNFCRSYFDFILSDNFAVLTFCVCVVRAWKQYIYIYPRWVLSKSSQHVVETVWCLGLELWEKVADVYSVVQ